MTRNALGRGLGALIREPEPQVPIDPPPVQNFAVTSSGAAVAPARDGAPTGGPLQIDIDLIDPSPFQPRTRFRMIHQHAPHQPRCQREKVSPVLEVDVRLDQA